MIFRNLLEHSRLSLATSIVAVLLASSAPESLAQQPAAATELPEQTKALPDAPLPKLEATTGAATGATETSVQSSDSNEKQSKRILWVFPNYRAVSADEKLPPLSVRDKFWLATEDSFDYSSFITTGALAGISQAKDSYPEFGHHLAAYGRYYWHMQTDLAVGNYMTEAILPTVLHQDPRYYTLGHGGFFKRTGYAVSRLLITRTDSGGETFNASEIVGNGAAAGIANTYYPARERTWTKTGQKWLGQIGLDGVFNIVKEFWPDINHKIFHGKY